MMFVKAQNGALRYPQPLALSLQPPRLGLVTLEGGHIAVSRRRAILFSDLIVTFWKR
jgi:hypothetical protein